MIACNICSTPTKNKSYCSLICRNQGPNWSRTRSRDKVCLECKNNFVSRRIDRKFCSRHCSAEYMKVARVGDLNPAWKGTTASRACENCGEMYRGQTKQSYLCSLKCRDDWHSRTWRGEKHHMWQGGKASIRTEKWYGQIHHWVRKHYGKPTNCANCDIGTVGLDWANISGEYKQDIADWVRLCRLCHKRYDLGKIKLKSTPTYEPIR